MRPRRDRMSQNKHSIIFASFPPLLEKHTHLEGDIQYLLLWISPDAYGPG